MAQMSVAAEHNVGQAIKSVVQNVQNVVKSCGRTDAVCA